MRMDGGGDRDTGKSNSDLGESREWVTEDKAGGRVWDGVLYSSVIAGTGDCIPGVLEPGARKLLTGQGSQLGRVLTSPES